MASSDNSLNGHGIPTDLLALLGRLAIHDMDDLEEALQRDALQRHLSLSDINNLRELVTPRSCD
jgi:hypothetical protein